MKRHILLVIVTCLASLVMASNTLSFSSVSGTPQTEVEVAVSLDNTDAIVALEMILPLGEHLKYVDNSAVLTEARSNGHQISAGQVGQELRVYIYSLSLNALQGNTGELMTFRLQLGNEPIDFALSPTLVLSNAQGKSVSSSVQTGNVTIQAPKLEILNPQIDFGHIPIRDTYTQDLLLKNVGTLPLSIENITTSNPLLIPLQTAMTIEANQTASVAIQYAPVEHGAISEKIVVYSSAPNGNQEVTVVADPFSVNELHIGRASGIANEEVAISLSMNNMAPIVAVQCSIALPEQLEYVPNSIEVNATRGNGHQTLATIKKYVPKPDQWDEFTGDTLVLMLFSMTNQVFNANDGEIASFKLRLNGNSGSYTLRPHDVALLTATAENMLSAAYEATVDVQSPSFNGDDYLSFGDWAITDDVVANYVIRNYGDAPLEIKRVTFLSQGYRVVSPMPLQINPWEESTMQIAYAPSSEGDFTTTMNIYTNDPTNSLKAVLISGHVYEPNSLTVDGARTPEGNYQLAISLSNYTDIVALQYDIHWRSDMTTSQSAFAPTTRLQNHNATVVKMDEDTYRVIIYSMANTPIIGNEGELHHLTFTPQGNVDYCGDVLTIDNIVLSNANGTDKVSQSTVLHHLPTTQYSEQTITACDEYVYNNKVYQSSGTYIDTLQTVGGCDSIVTTYLTINRSEREEYYETACDEYYWDHNGETYYESGDYEYYTTTEQGCERVEVLHLTINRSEREEYNVAACEEYWWHDNQYTESGDYEYRTTIESTTEKLYVGYDFQNEAIIGLTPPRGVSRFTVDGYITDGSGWCFVGTGSPENGNVDDGGDLRIFEYEETLHYDRVWGRQGHFYGDHRNPFNIEFGNYYAKNIETGEYYFIDEENVHEYSNTEYPLTLFYGDYGKIHKVQFFDNNNSLWADINAVIEGGVPMIKIDYYNPNGTIYHTQQFTENLQAETRTITEQGCERVEVLHLTILPDATAESETLALCPSELPYEWYGQWLTETGTYSATEQYVGMECDSIIHELTLNVYVQTLPATVTLPIVRTGEAIDVTIPTAEIQAHIAAETWYAPNALVAWYIMENSDWAALSAEPVATGITEVTLKYVVDTDCGNVESDKMVINLKTTDVENMHSQSPTSNCRKILYEDHIYILRNGKVYSVMGQEL